MSHTPDLTIALKLMSISIWEFGKKEQNSLLILIMAALFYFSLAPYLIKFYGIDVKSGFYKLNLFSNMSFVSMFTLNLIYSSVTIFLFYFVFYTKKKEDGYFVNFEISFILTSFIIIFGVVYGISNLSLSRALIKEESTLIVEIVYLTCLSITSQKLLVSKSKLVILFYGLLVIYFALILFEREVLLYAIVPLLVRVGWSYKKGLKVFLLFLFLLFSLLNYKALLSSVKFDKNLGGFQPKEQSLLYQLGVDSIHKLSLEVSYIEGEHPKYNSITLLAPYQLIRLVDRGRTTNGQLAKEYYTNNETGPGFSFILEGLINYSYLSVFILPFILLIVYLLSTKYFGVYAVTPFVVFLVKVQRAEFWPVLLATVIFPLFVIYVLRLARRMKIF